MSKQAYSYLVKILSVRDYSEHKLRQKLSEKKYPANEIDDAIDEIKKRGYLKEEIYTESRVRGFMNKGYSVDYIRQKLAQEKLTVPEDFIREVFVDHETSEEEQIERLARKKISSKTELDYDQKGKILRFLISKGHDYSLSKKVLESLVGELKDDLPFQDSI